MSFQLPPAADGQPLFKNALLSIKPPPAYNVEKTFFGVAMTDFLSEESILMHREYQRGIRLRYSILEKSVNGIKNKKSSEIIRQSIPTDVKKEVLSLLPELELHELFFDSFHAERFSDSPSAVRSFGSVGGLLNSVFSLGISAREGFVCIARTRGGLSTYHTAYPYHQIISTPPLLAVDICEHAYFSDYAFDKRAYLLAALPHLNLCRLDGSDGE